MNRRERRELRAEQEKLRDGGQAGPQSSVFGPQSLEVHIEELVLRGFAPGDRYGIGDAVEIELARLFVEQGVPSSLGRGGEIERLDGGVFEVAQGSRAEAIGAQVAQPIYGGLRFAHQLQLYPRR